MHQLTLIQIYVLQSNVYILQRQGVGQNWYGLWNKNVMMHDSYSKAFLR